MWKGLAAVLVTIALAAAPAAAQGAGNVRIAVRPDSRLWIEGGANVGSWSCSARQFEALVLVDTGYHRDRGTLSALHANLREVEVRVRVRALTCGNPVMDGDLYGALKAKGKNDSSIIVGRFDVAQPAAGDAAVLRTAGSLTVVGVERSVAMDITLDRLADGTLRTRGSVPMKMTDFGIRPPTAMLGLVKTRNELTVRFELLVDPRILAQAADGDGGH